MKKVVYDLDGTLVSFNTFKGWVILSMLASILSFKVGFIMAFLKLIYLRSIGEIDRIGFKSSLLRMQVNSKFWRGIGFIYARVISAYFIRNTLINLGNKNFLATAAPAIYANSLHLKSSVFDGVISSYFDENGEFIETIKDKKSTLVTKYFTTAPDIFYTDHHDDLPLARVAKFVYVVQPTERSEEIFRKELRSEQYQVISHINKV
jgi:phosphoserine phosphatase